jgi:UDP-N-acetylmuramoyl-tripeptide--D-alanyl-D-alanine ligase
MRTMLLSEVKEAIKGRLLQGDSFGKIKGVSINSRTIKAGELFIAIPGERFDGHDFIGDALRKGAAAVIIDHLIKYPPEAAVILVKDTTTALQRLAHYYRMKQKDLKVIAITGSAGKTSTKDITAAILKERFKICKTEGNFNNYFGLPLTLLGLDGDEEVAVLEMGMSKLGEINLLTDIARPDMGIITNVGPTHLEFLGSVENVARGKAELVEGLPADGIAVLNADNPYVRKMTRVFTGKKVIFYGIENRGPVITEDRIGNRQYSIDYLYGEVIETRDNGVTLFKVVTPTDEVELVLNKPGKHNIYNALAAIAVAREFGLNWTEIQNGLSSVEFSALRWEVRSLNKGIRVINDTYNANPLSMRAAIEAAEETATGRLITVLGAMLELGEEEEKAHRELGAFINQRGVDLLFTVGKIGEIIARGALESGMDKGRVLIFNDNKETARKLEQILDKGDTVLIKGSRGNKMEEIVEMLTELEE